MSAGACALCCAAMGKQARSRRARRDGEVAPAAAPAKAPQPPWWHSRWRVALACVCVVVMTISGAAMLSP